MSQKIEDETLKKQFENLQEQKQKKLLLRKQRQDEQKKQKTPAKSLKATAASTSFGVDDDLNLKLADPPVPSNSIFSEELVDHLNVQIRELTDESGRVYKLLSERDLELRILRKKQEDHKLLQGTMGSDAASTKIVELSKKIRQMSTEMESEKTKNRHLQRKALELENEVQNAGMSSDTKSNVSSARGDTDTKQDPDVVIKSLQDKLRHAEMKVCEFRNQSVSQKTELKLAQKVIEQEVGEGATVQSLIGSSSPASGWRGRYQQIGSLQKKVNDLRSQLELTKPSSSSSRGDVAGDDLEAEFMGSATSSMRSRRVDERQKSEIRRMERERKEQQEKLSDELKALEADHDALKTKFDSSKSRNKVLSVEVKSVKQQVQMLLDKGKHDDELVEALFKQIGQMKQALETKQSVEKLSRQDHDDTVRQLAQRTQQDGNMVEQLKAIVAEREAKVHALEEEIQQIRITANQHGAQQSEAFGEQRQMSDIGSSAQHSARTVMPEDCGSLTPQTQSRSGSRQEFPPTSSARVLTPPGSSHSARGQPAASEHRVALEELEEATREVVEYRSMCQAASVERDKLSELVGVLQVRVDEITSKAIDSQAELAAAKRKCVQLEKQLGKLRLEPASASKRAVGSKLSSSTNFEDGLSSEDQLEEVETNLLIQKDENEALKAALQSTLKAKEEDMKLYSQMIEDTKSIFLQGLRQFRDKAK